jgi:hypothetical protein
MVGGRSGSEAEEALDLVPDRHRQDDAEDEQDCENDPEPETRPLRSPTVLDAGLPPGAMQADRPADSLVIHERDVLGLRLPQLLRHP